jgi:hypothetical protein
VYKVISTLQRRKFVSILSHMELCNSKVNFASFEALKPINFSISVGENCRKTRQKIGFVCCCFDCGFLQCLVGADGVDDDGITGLDGVEDSSEAAQLGSLWNVLFVAHLVHWKLHGAAANFLEPVEITERSSQFNINDVSTSFNHPRPLVRYFRRNLADLRDSHHGFPLALLLLLHLLSLHFLRPHLVTKLSSLLLPLNVRSLAASDAAICRLALHFRELDRS